MEIQNLMFLFIGIEKSIKKIIINYICYVQYRYRQTFLYLKGHIHINQGLAITEISQ